MLFLPAAALCCLCSALVAMAELIQEDLTLTRRVGEEVSFSCGTDQCDYDNYVYWYQKKDTETFTRILRIDKSDGEVYSGYNHPRDALPPSCWWTGTLCTRINTSAPSSTRGAEWRPKQNKRFLL
ncbi:uncharacterized protein ABDE67_013745 [Symphorus nematophorus]